MENRLNKVKSTYLMHAKNIDLDKNEVYILIEEGNASNQFWLKNKKIYKKTSMNSAVDFKNKPIRVNKANNEFITIYSISSDSKKLFNI